MLRHCPDALLPCITTVKVLSIHKTPTKCIGKSDDYSFGKGCIIRLGNVGEAIMNNLNETLSIRRLDIAGETV